MIRYARVFNWIALAWTALGLLDMITTAGNDVWAFIFVLVLLAAQILALKAMK